MYFDVLGTPLLSINSYEAASDLLDKKGAIYSDRPRMPMIKELYVHHFHIMGTVAHNPVALVGPGTLFCNPTQKASQSSEGWCNRSSSKML